MPKVTFPTPVYSSSSSTPSKPINNANGNKRGPKKKSMPEHMRAMANYAMRRFDSLNKDKLKEYIEAQAKLHNCTEKKIRLNLAKYRKLVRSGKIVEERDQFFAQQKRTKWDMSRYNTVIYIIENFDCFRKKERKEFIEKAAVENNCTPESILKDLRVYRSFRDKFRARRRLENQEIKAMRLEELRERRAIRKKEDELKK
jgi:hypothetical protein